MYVFIYLYIYFFCLSSSEYPSPSLTRPGSIFFGVVRTPQMTRLPLECHQPQWVSSEWVPAAQGGLWEQHFTTEQDETGKSSSTQIFPINRFPAGHGFFGMKGLDKVPSCYCKCRVLTQLLAPVPFTLFSHSPAKTTHAIVKKPTRKNTGTFLKRESQRWIPQPGELCHCSALSTENISPQISSQPGLPGPHPGNSRLQIV